MITLGIMQPYFLPYIGYWQLMNYVDQYVIYDNIKYTKKGWINRNRFLQNSTDALFTLPLKSGSDRLNIVEREIADVYDARKLLKVFHQAYKKAPYFDETFALCENILLSAETNLFKFLHQSIEHVCSALSISTPRVVSSNLPVEHESLAAQSKVIAICRALETNHYINPIGGLELYDRHAFEIQGIQIKFLRTNNIVYQQFANPFVPNLSILDVLMFNGASRTRDLLFEFTLE